MQHISQIQSILQNGKALKFINPSDITDFEGDALLSSYTWYKKEGTNLTLPREVYIDAQEKQRERTQTKIVGYDGNHEADVILDNGIRKLASLSTVTVEQLLGRDPFPDTYFQINNAGVLNNTLRIQIAATTNDPSTPDRDAPAVDKTITVTSNEAGDEIKLRDLVITSLNNDSNFSNSLKAIKVPDLAIVHITSKYRGDFWERPNTGDFSITTTGSINVTIGFDNLVSRGKANTLSRDPNFPHKLGTFGISGTINVLPGAIGKRYESYFLYNSSYDMRVNGRSTPVVFEIPISATEDIFISQVRIFGGGNGIKFGQFLTNAILTNGIDFNLKSDNQVFSKYPIKKTEDLKNIFAFPDTSNFKIDVQSGADQMIAIFEPEVPFPLRKQGTFGVGNDDYIKIEINDNLSAGLIQLNAMAIGFLSE